MQFSELISTNCEFLNKIKLYVDFFKSEIMKIFVVLVICFALASAVSFWIILCQTLLIVKRKTNDCFRLSS